MPNVQIVDYRPGALGRVVELHAAYYAHALGFGLPFETKVATDMAGFLRRFDSARDLFRVVTADGRIGGSIALDASRPSASGTAHLRWFILEDALHGQGIGRRLLEEALDRARAIGGRGVHLWTVAGLDASRRLYEQAGFRIVEEFIGDRWGKPMTEQRWELSFA